MSAPGSKSQVSSPPRSVPPLAFVTMSPSERTPTTTPSATTGTPDTRWSTRVRAASRRATSGATVRTFSVMSCRTRISRLPRSERMVDGRRPPRIGASADVRFGFPAFTPALTPRDEWPSLERGSSFVPHDRPGNGAEDDPDHSSTTRGRRTHRSGLLE